MRTPQTLSPPPAVADMRVPTHTPPVPSVKAAANRLVSLDAYRGFVMILMASSGLKIADYVKQNHLHDGWTQVAYHLDHVQWRGTGLGAGLWDMIQPSFTFIVGVALPFSLAKRRAQGQSFARLTFHAFWRSLILIALGIFLRSLGKQQTNFTFEDTLSQIGLGYTFAFMLAWAKPVWQLLAVSLILIGYWLAFALYPLPPADFDYASVGVLPEWRTENPVSRADAPFRQLAGHWDKNTNAGAKFDEWFLNLFPPHTFKYNRGGYLTLSFIPTLGTMLLGLLAGNLMMSRAPSWKKVISLIFFGALAVGAGWALDYFGICPNVKKIWTPSWVLYSGGWACLLLALFYTVVDCAKQRWIAFPAVVVGMNSIAMYCLADGGFKGYIKSAFRTHLGADIFERVNQPLDRLMNWIFPLLHRPVPARPASIAPIAETAAVLLVLWLICFWMYRRKIFLRI